MQGSSFLGVDILWDSAVCRSWESCGAELWGSVVRDLEVRTGQEYTGLRVRAQRFGCPTSPLSPPAQDQKPAAPKIRCQTATEYPLSFPSPGRPGFRQPCL
ncbi:hypothetical protein P7K49_032274 [Saguinus oedipus]|uniref:Uncharacterized protein n=1 Tax=Saguinus oedipus TaxID=9490 RepID=A0ABQ9TXT3_SAGOE|nr:hypothetical protein P7K49_032274 [Saguinus oedipus]